MAVVDAVKLIDREGDSTTGKRTATDIYRVLFTIAGGVPDMNDARLATDPVSLLVVPRRGDSYSATDSALKCKTIKPRIERAPDWRAWLVACDFDTGDVGDENEDPLMEPPKVRWGTQTLEEPIYRDRFGQPIANSAKVTYDPAITREFYDSIAVITRNSQFYDETIAVQYRGKRNSTSFSIRGASTPVQAFKAKIADWVADEATKNGIDYWVETLTILMRFDGWNRLVLDQGYCKRNVDGTVTNFTDSTGGPLNRPELLNGLGDKLAVGAPAVFLEKEVYDVINFNNLNLPQA